MSNTHMLVFRVHALQAMFQRNISEPDIHYVVNTGKIIESYPDDQPYPSRLVLGWRGARPIHVVVGDNQEEGEIVIITAYEPDPNRWESGFEKKRVT